MPIHCPPTLSGQILKTSRATILELSVHPSKPLGRWIIESSTLIDPFGVPTPLSSSIKNFIDVLHQNGSGWQPLENSVREWCQTKLLLPMGQRFLTLSHPWPTSYSRGDIDDLFNRLLDDATLLGHLYHRLALYLGPSLSELRACIHWCPSHSPPPPTHPLTHDAFHTGWLKFWVKDAFLGEYFLESLPNHQWWIETSFVDRQQLGVVIPPSLLPAFNTIPSSHPSDPPIDPQPMPLATLDWIYTTVFWGTCHWDDIYVPESDPNLQEDFLTNYPGSSGCWYPYDFAQWYHQGTFPPQPPMDISTN